MKRYKNQQGVAMMMAIATMVVLSILAAELVYQTSVYSGIVFRQRDQLQARLLARSALRMGLLQLKAAEKAKTAAKNLGGGEGLTDRIWQTPLILPPPEPKGLSRTDQQALEGFRKSLGLNGTISVSISAESDRLSLNNLVWLTKAQEDAARGGGGGGDKVDPCIDGVTGERIPGCVTPPEPPKPPIDPEKKKEALAKIKKNYVEILDQLLEQKRKSDDDFREKFATVNAETLIGNLIAWMDPETKTDGDNRDKEDYYTRLETPYAIKNSPLNSESELYMVKGFSDPIVKLVTEHFSIQSSSSVNPNKATLSLLQALIPELNNEDLTKIETKRNETPFGKADDFWAYLETLGKFEDAKKRLTEQGIKFLEGETAYRIIVSAESGQANKTWMALVGEAPPAVDSPPVAPPVNPPPGGAAPPTKPEGNTDSKPLNIIYLKAD